MNLVQRQGQLPHWKGTPNAENSPPSSFLDMSIDEEEERLVAKRWTEKQHRLEKEARVRRLLHLGGSGGLAESISSAFLHVIRNTGKSGQGNLAKNMPVVPCSVPASPVGKDFLSADVDSSVWSRSSFSSDDSEDSKASVSPVLTESPTLMPELRSEPVVNSTTPRSMSPPSSMSPSDTSSGSSPELPGLDDSLSEAIEVDWITAIGEDYLDGSEESIDSPASTLLFTPPSSPDALSAGVNVFSEFSSSPTILQNSIHSNSGDEMSLQIADLIACMDLDHASASLFSPGDSRFHSAQADSLPTLTTLSLPCPLTPPSFLLSDVDTDLNVVVDVDKHEERPTSESSKSPTGRATGEIEVTKRRPDPALLSERWRPRGPPLHLTVRIRRRTASIPPCRSQRRFGCYIKGKTSSSPPASPSPNTESSEVSVFPLITYAAYTLAQLRWTIGEQLREDSHDGDDDVRPSGDASTTQTRMRFAPRLELEGNVSLSGGRTAFIPLANEMFYRQWVKERLRAGAVGEIECWCST